MQIKIEMHEAIIFYGNLCHACGRSDNRCPRIFCRFGKSYAALEGRNYINECTHVKSLGQLMSGNLDMNRETHRLWHPVQTYDTRKSRSSYIILEVCMHDLLFSSLFRQECGPIDDSKGWVDQVKLDLKLGD